MGLKKQINLFHLTFYGTGTILGAGIYVLVGKVAAVAGDQTPLSFLIASLVATVSGLAYCELSSHFPKSAAEAVYVEKAFNSPPLTVLVGYAVALTGLVSAATIARGFPGYLNLFFSIPEGIASVALVAGLTLVALTGVKESLWVITIITMIEILGLLWVIGLGAPTLDQAPELIASWSTQGISAGLLPAAFLAFYAFIGFEDMVNMSEEVINPKKNMPLGILLAIVISATIYFFVALVAVTALDAKTLSESSAPLAEMVSKYSSLPPIWMGAIGMVAIINGCLVQLLMVSRLMYGLAELGRAPKVFSKLSDVKKIPRVGTIIVAVFVIGMVLLFPIEKLASITSFIVLSLFTIINISLVKMRVTGQFEANSGFKIPLFVPILGAISCLFLIYSNL